MARLGTAVCKLGNPVSQTFSVPTQRFDGGARRLRANEGAAWIALFVRRVYEANFAHDLDIAQPKVLLDCLDRLVDDRATVFATARSNEAKSCLRRNTERAVELGIFGAPMTVVGQELFWGNDRLEAALAWQRAVRD